MDISGRKARGCHGDRTEFHRHTHPPAGVSCTRSTFPDWALFFLFSFFFSPFDKGAHAFYEALSIVLLCAGEHGRRGCGWSRDFRVDGFLRVACGCSSFMVSRHVHRSLVARIGFDLVVWSARQPSNGEIVDGG